MDQKTSQILAQLKHDKGFPPRERINRMKAEFASRGLGQSGVVIEPISFVYVESVEEILREFTKIIISNADKLNLKSETEIKNVIFEATQNLFTETRGLIAKDFGWSEELQKHGMDKVQERYPTLIEMLHRLVDIRDVNLDNVKAPTRKKQEEALPNKTQNGPQKKHKSDYGKWQIIKSIGGGGQSDAFLVKDSTNPGDSEVYVLKRLKNIDRIGRFKREVEVGLRLDHPNILRVIDFNLDGGTPYLVTEHCDGGDLEKGARSLELDLAGSLKTFFEICKGVAYAHDNGVIHRDIKPSNIFLAGLEKRPVVADFGICFISEEDGSRLTLTEEAVGARNYIPPELEDGRAEKIYPSSDIYPLGKLLYWLLTRQDFAREKHREPEYDLVKKFGPKLEHVNKLLDKMIVADPTKRFTSAVELLKQVEEVRLLLERNFNAIGAGIEQRCIYCGKGNYQSSIDANRFEGDRVGRTELENFGLTPRGFSRVKVFICDHCGNVQIFRPDRSKNPQIWD